MLALEKNPKIQSVHLLPTTILCSQQGGLKGQEDEGDSQFLHLLHIQSQNWLKCFTVYVLPQNTPLPLQNYLFQLHTPL